MSKKMPVITTEEWIRAAFGEVSKRPENSFTIDEACKQTGYKRTTMSRKIDEMVEAGAIVEKKVLINGRLTRVFCPVVKK